MKLSRKLGRLLPPVVVSAIAAGGSAAGAAVASPVHSITTVLSGTPLQTAPFIQTFYGSYTAYSASGAVVDSGSAGSLVAQAALPFQPPNSTQIETFRTITSPSGNGTLRLHCSDISRPAAPFVTSGSCAVLDASGVYAGLSGTGQLTGTLGPTTLTDTIKF